MNFARIASTEFPRFERSVRARWFPVYLEPVMGSAERFIIAVVAISDADWHLEAANALDRLTCLYGTDNGALVAEAARAVNDHLRYDLEISRDAVIDNWMPPITGANLGPVGLGEGTSVERIAASWLCALSSLHDGADLAESNRIDVDFAAIGGPSIDRLAGLVFDYVAASRPALSRFFRADLHDERRKRTYDVSIDFAGSRIAANFGTLRAGRPAGSVDFIKKRLWDLKYLRDEEGKLAPRRHEMLVQIPSADDPQITSRQYEALTQARDALEEQADHADLRLQTFVRVEEIGERLVSIEAGE